MICLSCRVAGMHTTELNKRAGLYADDLLDEFREQANKDHAKCQGCDCQHVVGQALNMTLIKAPKPAVSSYVPDPA